MSPATDAHRAQTAGTAIALAGFAVQRDLKSVFRSRSDSLLSACTLVAILAWIIVSDIRLHDQMTRRMQGMSLDLAETTAQLHGATLNMAAAAQASSLEFAHMWTFVAVAVVLTIWMFRT